MSKVSIIAVSHAGEGPAPNEDGFWFLEAEGCGVLAIADGLSGPPAGEVASRLALDMVQAYVLKNGSPRADWPAVLKGAADAANARVYFESQNHKDRAGLATTLLTAALCADGRLVYSHIGNSRLYLVRQGRIVRVTDDHTRSWEDIRNGLYLPRYEKFHPERNILTNAVGLGETVTPTISTVPLEPDDLVLAVTDGVTEVLEDQEILSLIARAGSTGEALDSLIREALSRRCGNVTAAASFVDFM